MSKTLIEFTALGKEMTLNSDYTETGPFVSFKMWYDVSDPDQSKRVQYGAWIERDTTPEDVDKLLLDFAHKAFLPHIKAEAEKVFGK